MLPENGESRPADDRTAPETTDHHDAIDYQSSDREQVRAEIASGVLGCLLDRCPAEVAAGHLAELDGAAFPNPCHRFVVDALRAAVRDGVDLTPAVVAAAVVRAGMEPPPAWLGAVLPALHALVSVAVALPQVGWHLDRLRVFAVEDSVRRSLLHALDRVGRCDTAELAVLVQVECASALAALAGVRR